jgi:hypothetical protein
LSILRVAPLASVPVFAPEPVCGRATPPFFATVSAPLAAARSLARSISSLRAFAASLSVSGWFETHGGLSHCAPAWPSNSIELIGLPAAKP